MLNEKHTCTSHDEIRVNWTLVPCFMSSQAFPSTSSPHIQVASLSPNSLNDSQYSMKLSRTRLAQKYLEEHVPQWRDDTLIQSLFANLPNREVKPEAFNQKYSFWKDLIISMTKERLLCGSVFKFESKEMSGSFKRGGLQPICLNGIILEMQSEGSAFNAADFDFQSSGSKRSSIVGGMVNWIFGSLKTIITGGAEGEYSDIENDELEAKIPSWIILPSLLKEQQNIIKDYLRISHMPLTFEEFHELVNESRRQEGLVEIVERDDILLILKYLNSEKLLSYAPVVQKISDEVVLAIKIKGEVSKVDFDIVKLKKLHTKLNYQVNELSDRIKELKDLAHKSLQISNDRKMAMYQLKRKALLEKVQGERLNSLHAVDEILLRISSVSDEAMIIEAYKAGANSLKELLPSVKDVDDAVDQLQGLMADHDEITQALNQNISNPEFDEELEEELKALTETSPKEITKSPLSKDFDDVDKLTSKLGEIKVDEEPKPKPKPKERTVELA